MAGVIEFEKIETLSKQSKKISDFDLTTEIMGLIQIYSVDKHSLLSTIDLFSTHFKIQKDITKSNAVEGYEDLLNGLKKEISVQDFDIFQINIVTENAGYILFADLNFEVLFGILKMNKQRLVRNIELTETNELRGTWTDKKFYFKGLALN